MVICPIIPDQAVSVAVMKSKLEGFLGAMAKLGSFDSNDSWARVRGVFDKLITHLFLIPKACALITLV